MPKILTSIGLMSGTSLDGIDAAIIKTDGKSVSYRGAFITIPYEENVKSAIRSVLNKKTDFSEVSRLITDEHIKAVQELLRLESIKADGVDVIGFHGQTVDHRPSEGVTIQIGDGSLLAKETGINVVNNFRINDVKHGGQGAPLVPLYHQALTASHEKPVAIVNIGGVSNISWIGSKSGDLIAFDTGPGNAPLDDWIMHNSQEKHDIDGKFSARGKPDLNMVEDFLRQGYFAKTPPKSLDRNEFDYSFLKSSSLEDGAATLTDIIARSIALAGKSLPGSPAKWYITGGGRHNKTIMKKLNNLLDNRVSDICDLGVNGDAVEAEAFAFLAVRHLYNMPISFPGTTGVKQQEGLTGGVFCPVLSS